MGRFRLRCGVGHPICGQKITTITLVLLLRKEVFAIATVIDYGYGYHLRLRHTDPESFNTQKSFLQGSCDSRPRAENTEAP